MKFETMITSVENDIYELLSGEIYDALKEGKKIDKIDFLKTVDQIITNNNTFKEYQKQLIESIDNIK